MPVVLRYPPSLVAWLEKMERETEAVLPQAPQPWTPSPATWVRYHVSPMPADSLPFGLVGPLNADVTIPFAAPQEEPVSDHDPAPDSFYGDCLAGALGFLLLVGAFAAGFLLGKRHQPVTRWSTWETTRWG